MLAVATALSGCSAFEEESEPAGSATEPGIELRRGARNGRELLPYMGVACPEPNSIRCDRVGVGIGVTRPARRMTASIAGRRIGLRSAAGGRAWQGFLQPAGLSAAPLRVPASGDGRWNGAPPVDATVTFTAEYADGSIASRTLRVPLAPGWG